MAVFFLIFFGSDPSKMNQTCKFGEQTSRILEFKLEGLEGLLNTYHRYQTNSDTKEFAVFELRCTTKKNDR